MTDQQKTHWLDYLKAKETARIAQETATMLEKDYIARYRTFENYDMVKSKEHGGISKISGCLISHNGELGYNVSANGQPYNEWYVTSNSIELFTEENL